MVGVVMCLVLGHAEAQVVYSLADCREMATAHNKEVRMAAEKVKAAESLQKAAKTQYLPSISANGGYVHNQKKLSLLGEDQYLPVYAYKADGSKDLPGSWSNGWTSVMGQVLPTDASGTPFNPLTSPDKIQWKYKAYIPKEAFEMDVRDVFVGGVTLTQPLFLGGKIVALNQLAESNKRLAMAQQEGEVAQTLVDTDVAYWRIVSLVNKEKLAKSYVDLLRKLETDIEKTVSAGMATKSDALSVRVKLNEAEMALLQVQDGLGLSRMALCRVCGLPLDASIKLKDEALESSEEMPAAVSTDAINVENRYEIKCLQQAVNMARSNERIAVSRFLPNAALTAGYTVSNPNMFNGVERAFGGQYQVGVVVNVPIFHFGERVHTLDAAKSERETALLKLEDAKEQVELDIAQATFKNNESEKKFQMAQSNKIKAEENLRYANVGFEAGTIAATTLMEAQTAWLKASSEHIDAQIDVRLGRVYLRKALGKLN
jgi:outer membrane protein TolC